MPAATAAEALFTRRDRIRPCLLGRPHLQQAHQDLEADAAADVVGLDGEAAEEEALEAAIPEGVDSGAGTEGLKSQGLAPKSMEGISDDLMILGGYQRYGWTAPTLLCSNRGQQPGWCS